MKRIITIIFCGFLLGCTEDYLNVKPDKSLVVPKKLRDYRALLDNTQIMNFGLPSFGVVGSADYDVTPARFAALETKERNALIWAKDIFETQNSLDWDWSYRRIFTSNRVLEGLEEIETSPKNQSEWNEIKGAALFHRAFAYFNLAQLFCKQYDAQTASQDLGLPIRLKSNINLVSRRATVQETYDRILSDLSMAVDLLPSGTQYKTRPSKHAGLALLARVYLQMENYEKALQYANLALEISTTLLDYNTLDPKANFPLPLFNEEVIFHATILYQGSFNPSGYTMSPAFLNLYELGDVRKDVFFLVTSGQTTYRGSYSGAREPFIGLSNNELYLIAAECNARKNQVAAAMALLNDLREKRWKKGTYSDLAANDSAIALKMILEERQREFVFSGLRWADLRRLNKDQRLAVTLSRTIGNQAYSLPPNDPRYVLPLPPDVIQLTGMEQNPR